MYNFVRIHNDLPMNCKICDQITISEFYDVILQRDVTSWGHRHTSGLYDHPFN